MYEGSTGGIDPWQHLSRGQEWVHGGVDGTADGDDGDADADGGGDDDDDDGAGDGGDGPLLPFRSFMRGKILHKRRKSSSARGPSGGSASPPASLPMVPGRTMLAAFDFVGPNPFHWAQKVMLAAHIVVYIHSYIHLKVMLAAHIVVYIHSYMHLKVMLAAHIVVYIHSYMHLKVMLAAHIVVYIHSYMHLKVMLAAHTRWSGRQQLQKKRRKQRRKKRRKQRQEERAAGLDTAGLDTAGLDTAAGVNGLNGSAHAFAQVSV
jgi:hypothetical protein